MIDRTLLIAEIGVNHDGDWRRAEQLIDAARDAGADVAKFQIFSPEEIVSPDAPQMSYQRRNTSLDRSQQAMLRSLTLSRREFRSLASHCLATGIEFLATAFDRRSFDFAMEIGIRRAKIPSGEITNQPLLDLVAQSGLPVLLSTGASTLAEIEQAVQVLRSYGNSSKGHLTVLHCVSQYPAVDEEVNLRALKTLAESLNTDIGLSDHSQGYLAATSAVAMGASVIEKHLTWSRHAAGPDHAASLEPGEFGQMVRDIRRVEVLLGSSKKEVQVCEMENRIAMRRSIVARKPIKTGEYFTEDNLGLMRPSGGLSPMRWRDVIGSRAPKNFSPGDWIEL